MNVGERIKYFRVKFNFSQNKLAEWSGVSHTHIAKIEQGHADITVGHLKLICDAFGITLREFFDIDDSEKDDIYSTISNLTPKQRALLLDFIKSM